MITMLRILMEKVENMQKQVDNVSREMEIKKKKTEMLDIKTL